MILPPGKRTTSQSNGSESFMPKVTGIRADGLNFSGIYSLFSFAHAQWVWDLKTQPRWVEAFEKIWGTKELLGMQRLVRFVSIR